jgi:hypothetical protein
MRWYVTFSVRSYLLTFSQHGSTFKDKVIRVTQKDSDRAGKPNAISSKPASTSPKYIQQPVTPMTPGYGAAYVYPYGSPYYSYPAYYEGQYYPASPYNYPPYYAYSGSPSYASGSTSTADASGGPSGQHYYGHYPQYPYWGYSPHAQAAYFAPAFTPTENEGAQEDRSATPTPTGHIDATESSLESQ